MLEITGIDVFHGDLQAVWDVSLIIEGKGITTLIGSNGSGKSTVLATIAGLLKPVRGSISFDGVRIDTLPAHKIVDAGIAMVPEGRRLFREMTVMDNLEMGAITKRARQMKNETMAWIFDVFPILKIGRAHV